MKYRGANLIGHRGLAEVAPENTREAFEIAIKMGLKWVETDIRMTVDKVLVLSHNPTYKNNLISSSTFKKLQALSDYKLLCIEDLIESFKDKLYFNFDVKDIEAFPKLLDYITKYSIENQVLISSFHHPALLNTQKLKPVLKYAPIIASRMVSIKGLLYPFKKTMNILVADSTFCDVEMIKEVKTLGFELYLYNIDSLKQVNTFVEEGVSGIIIDDLNILKVHRAT